MRTIEQERYVGASFKVRAEVCMEFLEQSSMFGSFEQDRDNKKSYLEEVVRYCEGLDRFWEFIA